MTKRRVVLAGGLVAFALVAASCGAAAEQISEKVAEKAIEVGAGEGVDVDISGSGDDFTVSVDSEDGSFAVGSDVDLPEALTIPVPDGGNVTAAGTDGASAFAAIVYSQGGYDEIAGFYEDWTSKSGDEWTTTTGTIDMGDQTQRSSSWTGPNNQVYISVSDCIDTASGSSDLDAVCVTINDNG